MIPDKVRPLRRLALRLGIRRPYLHRKAELLELVKGALTPHYTTRTNKDPQFMKPESPSEYELNKRTPQEYKAMMEKAYETVPTPSENKVLCKDCPCATLISGLEFSQAELNHSQECSKCDK